MWRYGVIVVLSCLVVLAANRKILPLISILSSSPKEIILAEKMIDLDGDKKSEKVIKLKKGNSLALQIYELKEDHGIISTQLTTQYEIPESEDSFIYYKTRVTNLAFIDSNQDNQQEIIVSFFDKKTKTSSFCTLLWNKDQKTLTKAKGEDR
ncbi:MAG: hypothetical protein A2Z91_06735 [Deltaproteobacteria bacterium GWA2_38_16]|nr:MAG: hypothetical protein A2Z91_06735 [Deltaproteobacteria bacterium GWA2_38_16]OGQ03395.1 MAG: hypothetical protein A3D19_04675 [Deltaproteobacteria bacterium RIFCSPHIGHO2_02_FULL_38_15]OGQ34722.1 MAG: hypothetical protein A3A72_07460 [Deltaproteobacteria bacterium RIFCSPLOWO2_01_FULL_38_9]OGQ61930.1 MAG: hypothetical protein A3G92_04860 [Deltaproteobacteria bacterium RIFCSPLOWO2_12_FULL_38_8]HBQ20672.1 hypothetical protein [Deltaproteobacteria bacterium]